MLFSIITPNYNGAAFLEQTIDSILAQKQDVELEYIVVDGGSTDGSLDIIDRYADSITHCIIEKDSGPADAINKGLRLATGDVVAWLNSDDLYFPGTLARVRDALQARKTENAGICFGGCAIINEQGREIRNSITTFKELFFPLSCRFIYQCINYLSQPSLFFCRHAVNNAGLLREDMTAAWDYEYILRLWHSGAAVRVKGSPLAAFRWHENSISSQHFRVQFKEEYLAAKSDAGLFSLQTFIHFFVRWGIIGTYKVMIGRKHNNVGG